MLLIESFIVPANAAANITYDKSHIIIDISGLNGLLPCKYAYKEGAPNGGALVYFISAPVQGVLIWKNCSGTDDLTGMALEKLPEPSNNPVLFVIHKASGVVMLVDVRME